MVDEFAVIFSENPKVHGLHMFFEGVTLLHVHSIFEFNEVFRIAIPFIIEYNAVFARSKSGAYCGNGNEFRKVSGDSVENIFHHDSV